MKQLQEDTLRQVGEFLPSSCDFQQRCKEEAKKHSSTLSADFAKVLGESLRQEALAHMEELTHYFMIDFAIKSSTYEMG